MKKKYYFAALLGAFLCVAPSCSNENDEVLDENPVSEKLAYDTKGEDNSEEDIIISVEDLMNQNGLKASASVSGGPYYYELKIKHGNSNNFPAYIDDYDGRYYKIDVDLNEGAGGEWIYLYVRPKAQLAGETHLRALCGYASTKGKSWFDLQSILTKTCKGTWATTPDDNGNSVDLNAGSGGKYVYLGQSNDSYWSPITNIRIFSTTTDHIYTRSMKFEGDSRTYYPVQCVSSINDNARRNVFGQTLEFNMDTKKHSRNVYIFYTRD